MSITVAEDILNVNSSLNTNVINELTTGIGITFNNSVIHNSYSDMKNITTPATPASGVGRLYAKTGGGLFWLTPVGVSEIDLTKGYRSYLYDAVVDSSGIADYTLPSAAFAAGNKMVFIRTGTYNETASVNIPDGGGLIGESKNVIINFTSGLGIVADGNAGTSITTGTIAVSNGTNTVTGTGTSFTSLNPVGTNTYITIDQISYLVSSVASNISLTLSNNYKGRSNSGLSFKAQKMLSGINIQNLTVLGGLGIYLRATRLSLVEKISSTILQCLSSDNTKISNVDIQNSTGVAFTITDSNSCVLDKCVAANSTGVGINLTGSCSNILMTNCNSTDGNNNGLNITGTSSLCNATACVFDNNGGFGINVDNTTNLCTIEGCAVRNNGNSGIQFNGTNGTIDNCVVDTNASTGVLLGNNCIVTNSQISNNSTGVDTQSSTLCIVQGNEISGNTGNGVSVGGNSAFINSNFIRTNGVGIVVTSSTNHTISSNFINNNTGNGITIQTSSSNNQIGDNTINSNSVGISIGSGCNNNNITGNTISSNTGNGISVSGNTCIVNSNRCVSNGGYGVSIASGATDNTVLANNLQGNTTGTFSDAGTITSLEGILINQIDSRSATTLAIGANNATQIQLAKTGVTTVSRGNHQVSQILTVDTANNLTAGNGILAENVRLRAGYMEIPDVSAPANPSNGFGRLYKKTGDAGCYWKPDASGAEVNLALIGSYCSNVNSSTTISTTSTSYILAIGMTITPASGTYMVIWSASLSSTSDTGQVYIQIYAGGVAQSAEMLYITSKNGTNAGLCCTAKITVNGSQAIEGRWKSTVGTGRMTERILTITQVLP